MAPVEWPHPLLLLMMLLLLLQLHSSVALRQQAGEQGAGRPAGQPAGRHCSAAVPQPCKQISGAAGHASCEPSARASCKSTDTTA